MPVYKLAAEMPYDEMVKWTAYFEQRPVDWREDSRTYKLLQAQGVKAKPEQLFPTLVPIYRQANANADRALKYKGSFFEVLASNSTGGARLD